MTLRFETLRECHIPEAAELAHEAYLREHDHVPALGTSDIRNVLRTAIARLLPNGHGVAAIDGNRLAGYLCFAGPIENHYGCGTGAYSPLHGNAITGDDRTRLMSLLFQHAATNLVELGVDSFAITAWHHDVEIAAALALNGFGMRCADAIRVVAPLSQIEPPQSITFREMHWEEAGPLLPLVNGLCRHLRQSPTFLNVHEFTEDTFAARLSQLQNRHFAAVHDETPIGYVEVTDTGENVLTTSPTLLNICGAYLMEEFRGRAIYPALLNYVLTTLQAEGVERIGVDYETMNPAANGFWKKHFDQYTTSFARRLDVCR